MTAPRRAHRLMLRLLPALSVLSVLAVAAGCAAPETEEPVAVGRVGSGAGRATGQQSLVVGKLTAADARSAAPSWPMPSVCGSSLNGGRATPGSELILGGQSRKVAEYSVEDDGTLGGLRSGVETGCHRLSWRLAQYLFPPENLAMVEQFVVFEPANTSSRDGEAVGFVRPLDDDMTRWAFGVVTSGLDDRLVAFTTVHELGHLVSLNSRQIVPAPDGEPSCPTTYSTGHGCARPGSLIDTFVKTTWTPGQLSAWTQIMSQPGNSLRERLLEEFYRANAASFVDRYASTDPVEDFAESFAWWCMGKPMTRPALAKKSRFFSAQQSLTGLPAKCRTIG